MTGPTIEEEQALYDAARAAPFPFPPGLGSADGDVELRRLEGGGGADDIVFDILGGTARNSSGTPIQLLTDTTIISPDGETLCTKGTAGGFVQLRDTDGTVLLSNVGPLVFEGQPVLAGKTPIQQVQELSSRLRFSYDNSMVVDGFASSGEDLVEASVAIQFSSGWRKLVIASLVDGYCGSDGLPD